MKSISLGLLCLLGTLALAQEPEEATELPIPPEELPVPIVVPITVSTSGDLAVSSVVKLNWFQAEAACASHGFTLASLETQVKQNRIYSFLLSSGQINVLTDPIWTSGSNLAVATQWSWFKNGAPFKYRNFLSPPDTSFRCLGFNALTSYWTAEDCNSQRYFVCEKRC